MLIDDDEMLRESLVEQFALHEEFQPMAVASATDAIQHVKAEHVDLVILDVGLPDMDGREACKLMRKNGLKSPVIMLTGSRFRFRHHSRS